MADENLFTLQIISPDRIFYEGEASFVEMVTSEGEIGVYKNHIPMTNILVPGIVKIHESNGVKEAAVHAGFVEILPDKIVIMAEVAEWPDEIDINRAEEARKRAERRLSSNGSEINVARAEAALKRSLTRIQLKGK
ncbi:ATP synthase F1 subunit epsilon [Lachnospiraceae bacterium HCP1S3_C3]|nr:ATP synthase F1 subunit epsilon [Lachnospiraceae bacterium]MDD6857057.1 ATP synthase F1 subunit epsilon [Lachnospiraceae bacterium]